MARPVTSPNDQAATLRNLKVLVVLLVVSNILVGALGVYLLRAVDQRYSDLVSRSVPVLNDLRELMAETVLAMRATNVRNFSGPAATHSAAVQSLQQAFHTAQDLRAKLLQNGSLKDEPAFRESLRKSGTAFDATMTDLVQLYAAEKISDANRLREEKLLPAFDQHLAAIGKVADAVQTFSLGTSDDYTSRTNAFSTLVLGVASWPVIVLAGLLLLTAVFVVAMMIAFRGKDLADAP